MANLKSIRSWNAIWEKVQSFFGFSGVDSPFSSGPAVIDEPLTLYVETTGNDANPGTVDRPYRTIQAALDYLKAFEIRAQVTVQVGAGTFDGFLVPDFEVVPTVGAVNISGTLVDLYTGTTTGGSASTVIDSSKSWTVDSLKGNWIVTNSTTTPLPILDNDATSFLALSGTIYTAGQAYRVVGSATTVTPNRGTSSGTFKYCVLATNRSVAVAISNMNFDSSGTSTSGALIGMGDVFVNTFFVTCQFKVATSGTLSSVAGNSSSSNGTPTATAGGTNSRIYLSRCSIYLEKASSTAFSGPYDVTYLSIYVRGGNKTQVAFSSITGTTGHGRVSASSASYFENLGYCFGDSFAANATRASVNWNVSGTFVDCGVVCNVQGSIKITGSRSNFPNFGGISSGNTNFILIDKNTTVQLNATGDIPSGLATTDISVNGATTTIAGMGSVFPAAPNAYHSCVYV